MSLIRNCTGEYFPVTKSTSSQGKSNEINQLTTTPDQRKIKFLINKIVI